MKVLGLKEGAVEWAYDDNNKDLVSAEDRAYLEQIQADIISGKVAVHDYMSNNSCDI